MKEYLKSVEEVITNLKSSEDGLNTSQVKEREEKYGKNRLIEGKKVSLMKRFLLQLADPMIIILIVAAIVSGATAVYEGESFTDVIIIMIVVIINAVLCVVQESKIGRAHV